MPSLIPDPEAPSAPPAAMPAMPALSEAERRFGQVPKPLRTIEIAHSCGASMPIWCRRMDGPLAWISSILSPSGRSPRA